LNNLTVVEQDTLLNVFLAIAVDNLANAQELTAAEEAAAAEQALKVCICFTSSVFSPKKTYFFSFVV